MSRFDRILTHARAVYAKLPGQTWGDLYSELARLTLMSTTPTHHPQLREADIVNTTGRVIAVLLKLACQPDGD